MSGTPLNVDGPEGETTTSILTDLRASGGSASAGQEQPSLPSRSMRRVNTQTLVLALVLTASAGSLYMMRRQGMNSGLKLDPTTTVKWDKEVENLRTAPTQAQQRIIAALDWGTLQLQVPLERLHKNPFVLPEGEKAAEQPKALDDGRRQRELDIQTALGTLQLNGIMQGPVPLARMNTKLVRVGDRIDQFFLVAQIHDRSVDLIADGKTYTINMGEANGGSPAKPNPRAPANPPRR